MIIILGYLGVGVMLWAISLAWYKRPIDKVAALIAWGMLWLPMCTAIAGVLLWDSVKTWSHHR